MKLGEPIPLPIPEDVIHHGISRAQELAFPDRQIITPANGQVTRHVKA